MNMPVEKRPKGPDDALVAGLELRPISAQEYLNSLPLPPAESKVPESEEEAATSWEIPWPAPIAKEALIGVLGDITRTLEPHTEADPAAILLQSITLAGHLIGIGPHFKVEGTKHSTNEYVVLVGTTSKGRKGTSWGRVREIGEAAVGNGPEGIQTINGLGSGEALISMIANKADDQGLPESEVTDRKRVLVMETEFSHPLRVSARDGSTLSPTMRALWDGDPISNNTKGEKATSTGHHGSVIGHITSQELLTLLSSVEVANGMANRHLFVVVKRSKYLPEGGNLDSSEVEALGQRLALTLQRVTRMGKVPVPRDPEARALWAELYRTLSDGLPGLAGCILARGEAHVTRLSLIYALLDGSSVIRVQHLLAALAVWDYCVGSVLYLFGDKVGDPVADRILSELRSHPGGLSRTDITRLFQNNKASSDLSRSLRLLQENGLATMRKERGTDPNQKRPAEVWEASNGIKFVSLVGSKAVPSYLETAKAILSRLDTKLRTKNLTKLIEPEAPASPRKEEIPLDLF